MPAKLSGQPSGLKTGQLLLDSAPPERTDAARNRRKILDAANRLIARAGIGGLTMDQVAREAKVGVGTVYRRFGDLGELAYALLDEREHVLQALILNGPPPLGHGAPTGDRVRAFLHALLDRVEEQNALLLVAETNTPTSRYTAPTYGVYHVHLYTLLRAAGVEQDAHYLADVLLAPLAASLVAYQRRDRGMSVREIKHGLDRLIDSVLPR